MGTIFPSVFLCSSTSSTFLVVVEAGQASLVSVSAVCLSLLLSLDIEAKRYPSKLVRSRVFIVALESHVLYPRVSLKLSNEQ